MNVPGRKMLVTVDDAAPAPPIPMQTTLRRSNHPRRRSSLPPLTARGNRKSRNHVRDQPASPEVISSLISSLASLSSPAGNHLPDISNVDASHSTPASPSGLKLPLRKSNRYGYVRGIDTLPKNTSGGFGMDYGAYTQVDNASEFRFFDDAATPPIVRTSRPPSGQSQLSKGQASEVSRSSSLKNFVRSGSRSSASKMTKDQQRISAIEDSTCEPTVARSPVAGGLAMVRDSWKGGRSHRTSTQSIAMEESREHEEEGEIGSKNGIKGGVIGLGLERVPDFEAGSPSSISRTHFAEDTISEEPVIARRLTPEIHRVSPSPSLSTAQSSPTIAASNLSPGGVAGPNVVPDRDSSLYETQNRKRSSQKIGSHVAPTLEEPADIESQEQQLEDDIDTDDEVTRRIRELKAQKRIRDHPPTPIKTDPAFREGRTISPTSSYPTPPADAPEGVSALASVQVARMIQLQEKRQFEDAGNASLSAMGSGKISGELATDESVANETSKGHELVKRVPSTNGRTRLVTQKRCSSYHQYISQSSSPSSVENRQISPASPSAKGQDASSFPRPSLILAEDRPSSAESIDDAIQAYLCSPRLSQKVRHPQTRRIISFSEVGDPEGFAVFCCVGMGLTRYVIAFYDELARTLGLRLIAPDRPGVGESEPYSNATESPLSWPAGAIYALATALRTPQHIRGRIHLLAPWIPASQMSDPGSLKSPPPAGSIPTAQRILRALPTPMLKVANSSFMSATSASITSNLPKSPRRSKRKSGAAASGRETPAPGRRDVTVPTTRRNSLLYPRPNGDIDNLIIRDVAYPSELSPEATIASNLAEKERQSIYDTHLTHAIWDAATRNANPALDLVVCLERRQNIGFRYVDITRGVVIHHGSKDTRVPVENIKWLGKAMRRCEVRILEGEGHGLMASAAVMGNVLMEIAKEWEDWTCLIQGKDFDTKKPTVS
ncbi:MAG: hypothetical protein M1827_003272 [Pycnora praestabilis]|nr:MAG: hypothetical protein M1827_003272 [Pycnora praestabilis]